MGKNDSRVEGTLACLRISVGFKISKEKQSKTCNNEIDCRGKLVLPSLAFLTKETLDEEEPASSDNRHLWPLSSSDAV